ncbi:chloride channel protein [Lactovum miscens]|uniref:H+/Cl- antiporter ClcA n=1 Tax=Lactovum miscens TaxID=190387 RepID=A0A841C9Q7_9LACT|nr:chloride channel protein [Lactovum miscens]MBB5888129.1 H+/Cl- antiporter ClcA [Lactovum miscens]
MKNKNLIILPLSILVLGLLAGTGAGLLSLFLDLIEGLFLGFKESPTHPSSLATYPPQRLESILIGGFIAALIGYFIRRKHQIPKISETMVGAKMPFWRTVLHVLTQIFYVGTGGSVGRELAPRELGALFANKWDELLQQFGLVSLSAEDKSLLIAAAAGAGFAGAYIAPITGMFFCIEILHKKISARAVSVSLSMSIIAALIGSLFKGNSAYYAVGSQSFSNYFMILVIVISPISGLIGAYFRKTFLWAEAHQSHNKHILWLLPFAALVTGIISMRFPEIMGNGRALAQEAMNIKSTRFITILLLLMLLKGFITVVTIRSGAAGGTLTPALAIGACVGAIICLILPGFPVWQGALVGATSLLAAAQQAPLMALFMLIEVTHLPLNSAVPLGFAVAIAMGISKLIIKHETIQPLEDE